MISYLIIVGSLALTHYVYFHVSGGEKYDCDVLVHLFGVLLGVLLICDKYTSVLKLQSLDFLLLNFGVVIFYFHLLDFSFKLHDKKVRKNLE